MIAIRFDGVRECGAGAGSPCRNNRMRSVQWAGAGSAGADVAALAPKLDVNKTRTRRR